MLITYEAGFVYVYDEIYDIFTQNKAYINYSAQQHIQLFEHFIRKPNHMLHINCIGINQPKTRLPLVGVCIYTDVAESHE